MIGFVNHTTRGGAAGFGSICLLFLAAAALGGCQKAPGGQVVAVVNSEEITQQELRTEAETSGMFQGQDFQSAAPAVLQRVIQRNLLADYAQKHGLDRTPEYVLRRRQFDQSLLATLALRKIYDSVPLPTAAESQAFIAANPAVFARRERLILDQVRFPTPPDSKQIKMLAALGSLSAIEAKLKADHVPVARGTATMDTGTVAPEVASQVSALPNDQVFDLSTGGMTYVSTITGRSNIASAPTTWPNQAKEIIRRAKLQTTANQVYAGLRKSAKITYDATFKPAG